jgi:hypothetical protein
MSAICVEKGGMPIENYVGRFFAADVLEFIVSYGERMDLSENKEVLGLIEKFKSELEKVKDLITPSQKPIYEMTLEEFEKIMSI